MSDGSHCSSDLLFTSTISAHSLHAGCLSDYTWLIDSGASFHVTLFKDSFCKYRVWKTQYVYLGDNHACLIKGMGDVKLQLYDGSAFMLHDVRYVPELKKNLISTGQLDDMGYHTTFGA